MRKAAILGGLLASYFSASGIAFADSSSSVPVTVNTEHQASQNKPSTATEEGYPMTHDELRKHGQQLRAEIEKRYKELVATRELRSLNGNDIDDVVLKYVPLGTSFDDAEKILRDAGFKVDPRPGANPSGNRPDRHDVVASINPFVSNLESKTSVYVFLSPSMPGKYTKVSKLSAGITTSFP